MAGDPRRTPIDLDRSACNENTKRAHMAAPRASPLPTGIDARFGGHGPRTRRRSVSLLAAVAGAVRCLRPGRPREHVLPHRLSDRPAADDDRGITRGQQAASRLRPALTCTTRCLPWTEPATAAAAASDRSSPPSGLPPGRLGSRLSGSPREASSESRMAPTERGRQTRCSAGQEQQRGLPL